MQNLDFVNLKCVSFPMTIIITEFWPYLLQYHGTVQFNLETGYSHNRCANKVKIPVIRTTALDHSLTHWIGNDRREDGSTRRPYYRVQKIGILKQKSIGITLMQIDGDESKEPIS